MNVVVLMGGTSAEREISLRTGRGIAQSLRNLGHRVAAVDAASGRALPASEEAQAALPVEALDRAAPAALVRAEAMLEADVVFIALHGGAGENGVLQALLDLAGKAYTGSGVLASALAMNKAMSKRIFVSEGLPTPRWALVASETAAADVDVAALGGYPLVVKPNEEGSSVGLTIVNEPAGMPEALRLAGVGGSEILIEEFIDGRELTVSVLGDRVLPIVEIRPRSGIYDYTAKYTAGMSEYFCPADLPPEVTARVQGLGLKAAQVLGCRGASRADFRLTGDGVAHCLEVNTIPGMTPTSLVPMAAKAAGMSYDQLVQRMLELAIEEARTHGRDTGRAGASTRS